LSSVISRFFFKTTSSNHKGPGIKISEKHSTGIVFDYEHFKN